MRSNSKEYYDKSNFNKEKGWEYPKVLDAECGKGKLTNIFFKSGYNSTGFDFSSGTINTVREQYPHIDFRTMDRVMLRYNEKFELIFASGFSLFNTRNFQRSSELINQWKCYFDQEWKILITTRSNFTGEAPKSWGFLNKEEINKLYSGSRLKKKVYFLFSPLWLILWLLLLGQQLFSLANSFSEKRIMGILYDQ